MQVNNSMSIEQQMKRASFRRILIAILIICVLLVIGVFVFSRFKGYSEARLTMREAKNIKMTLEMADMEYRGMGYSIYDETAEGNIRSGAVAYVNKIQGNPEGRMRLFGYDSTSRKITGFEYETDEYIVRYQYIDNKDTWKVFQIKELLAY
ncbi:MAG: hypothetical protein K6G24_03855 [Lachnospiraceae bacterium]|nr:hypothetical protein [Lachnospiraceae bacterium]